MIKKIIKSPFFYSLIFVILAIALCVITEGYCTWNELSVNIHIAFGFLLGISATLAFVPFPMLIKKMIDEYK